MTLRRFEGVLHTTAPLHVAEPGGEWRINPATNRIEASRNDIGTPITRTVRQRIMKKPQGAGEAVEQAEWNIPYYEVPLIPANLLRGRLRRLASDIVFDYLKSVGQATISDRTFLGMRCGATYGGLDTSPDNIERILQARADLFLGIFGGAPAMFRSGYAAFDALPIVGPTLDAGRVPEDYRNDYMSPGEHCWDFTQSVQMIRTDDFLRLRDPRELEVVENYLSRRADRLQEKITNDRDRRTAKAKNTEARKLAAETRTKAERVEQPSKSTIDNMFAIEVANPNLNFYFRVELADYLSEAQVGFMAMVLARFATINQLGGWTRAGYGRYDLDLRYFADPLGPAKPALEYQEAARAFVPAEETFRDQISLYAEALSKVTPASLERHFVNLAAQKESQKASS